MEPVIEDICDKMGDLVYGIDCASLEERVLQLLQEKNTSLAVAESCTGGLLAQRITDIPGASAHFLGGVVTYTEDAKVRLLDMDEDLIAENGVVSMPVAAKMAKRVRKALGSDIGHRHHRLGRARRGRRGARVRGARLARRLLRPPSAMRPRAAAAHPAHRGQQRFGYDPAVSHRIGCIK